MTLDMSATLADQDEFVKVLYYGDAGTGKTTASMHLAHLGPVVAVNAEGGIKKGPLGRLGVPTDKIVPFPAPGQRLSFEMLDRLYWDLKATLDDAPDQVAGLLFDSFTEVSNLLLEDIVDTQTDKDARRGKPRDLGFVDRSDYGILTEQLRRLTRRFRDLPCHVGFVALERRDTDNDGAIVYNPALTPMFAKDLRGYVDVVIYMTTVTHSDGTVTFAGVTRVAGKYRGKDRFGVLPATLADPTFDRVIAYVRGDLTRGDDSVQDEFLARIKADEAADAQD